jgi:RNA polymerase sigma-70 factor (ECF subfamily)
LVGSHDAAQDVAQDVFVQVWEQRKGLDPQRAIKAYLFTLAKHRALNDRKYEQVRERYQARVLDEASRDLDVGRVPSREEEILTVATVQAALRELPERRRMAVRLRIEEQLSHAEIAQVLEMSAPAAERLVQRGLEELRRILRSWDVSGLPPPEL